MKIIDKPWGKEEILSVREKYMVKRLHMFKGKRCSLQYHNHKMETLIVVSGILLLHLNNRIIEMHPGDFHTIVPGEIHRMEGKEDAVYIECSTPEMTDVVRIEDDYGR